MAGEGNDQEKRKQMEKLEEKIQELEMELQEIAMLSKGEEPEKEIKECKKVLDGLEKEWENTNKLVVSNLKDRIGWVVLRSGEVWVAAAK